MQKSKPFENLKNVIILYKTSLFCIQINERFAKRRNDSNEAALPLRSRRSGTKFAAP